MFITESLVPAKVFGTPTKVEEIINSLRPTLPIQNPEIFLGQAAVSPGRHLLYLVCCISLTASPGSLQFFLQETLFDDLWNKSHSFMLVSLVCLTLNSFHFFRLGQQAFLGEMRMLRSQSPS